MSKVSEVVRDALLKLRVLDADEAPEARDMQDGIRALNLMMASYEAEGVSVGWSIVSLPDDQIPCGFECEKAIGFLLARDLRPNYGVVLEPDVVKGAEDGETFLLSQVASADYSRISYPDLPVGQGQPWGAWHEGYYR